MSKSFKSNNNANIHALRASSRQMRLERLQSVGYTDGSSVIPSGKDKANSAKRQRQNFNSRFNEYD